MSFKYQTLLGDASIDADSVITAELDATVANIQQLNVKGNADISGITTLNEMSAIEAGIAQLTIAETFTIPTGAGDGKVLTSDATGVASWQLPADVALGGDVIGAASNNTVSKVGGSLAADVHSAELLANGATSNNTSNTIVKRNEDGNFDMGHLVATSGSIGTLQVEGACTVAGTVTAASTFTYGGASIGLGATVGGDLSVAGTSTLHGVVTLDNNIIVAGESSRFQGITCQEFMNVHGQVLFDSTVPNLFIHANAGAGKVLTCADTDGTASWQTPTTTSSVTMAGDVTGSSNANTVSKVGGSTAASVASATVLANAATNLNTVGAIVKRDGSGNFTAGTITATLNGNATSATTATTATTATSATTATTATSFTGSLTGDCTGTQGATVVNNLANGTVPVNTLVTLGGSQTLTNKTLTSPTISTILNTGTLTLPTTTGTLVGRTTVDTLTNKTLTAPVISSIVNTGTLTLPTSTDTLVGKATVDSFTNKTITGSTNTITANKIRNGTIETAYGSTAPSTGNLLRFDGTNASWSAPSVLGDSMNTANTLALRNGSGGFAMGSLNATAVTCSGILSMGNQGGWTKEIVLYDVGSLTDQSDCRFSGFGINSGVLRYNGIDTGTDHVWFAGTGQYTANEIFRIKGNGAVNMGGTLTASGLAATNITTSAMQMAGVLSTNTIIPYSGTTVTILNGGNLVVNGTNCNLNSSGNLTLTGRVQSTPSYFYNDWWVSTYIQNAPSTTIYASVPIETPIKSSDIDYNTANSVITLSIAGVYKIHFNLYIQTSATVSVNIYWNGAVSATMRDVNTVGGAQPCAATIIRTMAAGDTIRLMYRTSGGTSDIRFCSLTNHSSFVIERLN